jgi:hypothetical protein
VFDKNESDSSSDVISLTELNEIADDDVDDVRLSFEFIRFILFDSYLVNSFKLKKSNNIRKILEKKNLSIIINIKNQ